MATQQPHDGDLATGDPAPTSASLRSGVVDQARRMATTQAMVFAAVELVWATTHFSLYPFGTRSPRRGGPRHGYRIEHLNPVRRGMLVAGLVESGTPILLLHGFADNHSIFTVLRRGLLRRGFSRVFAMNYSVRTRDVRTAAAQLAEEVEAIVEETGYERIHIVAHSLGGVVARYYVTRLGGDERIHTLATLGAPHTGTLAAYLLPTSLTRQLRPGSALMQELNEPAPGCRTRIIAFWSDTDEVIVPAVGASLQQEGVEVTNVRLRGVGHLSLPILPTVVHKIATSLVQIDSEGNQTASVTDISA
ncbi:esterase/lipase family protein [Janibacter indicus]|uniref:Putative serine esterase n=1 Tax=Janibacter indicus TaxID=857417 RepID=A0A1W1ZPG0_9MICO|nr:alpha/beta fold hydrolase [Janibacter indicus]SMC49998.1 Putative serine esterase [Janibacter indicus]